MLAEHIGSSKRGIIVKS